MFWVTVPPSILTIIQIVVWLPLKHVTGGFKEKLKMIDYLGTFTQIVSIVFILVSDFPL